MFFADINSWKACKHGWPGQITKVVSVVIFNILSFGDDNPVSKWKTQTFIHAFFGWCVFQKHKIKCQQSLISAIRPTMSILYTIGSLKIEIYPDAGTRNSKESYQRAIVILLHGAKWQQKFLDTLLDFFFRQSLRIWSLIKFGWLLRQKWLLLCLDYNHQSLLYNP